MNMPTELLRGELVRLTAANADTDVDTWAGWSRNSEFLRLLDSDPAHPWSRKTLRTDLEELPKDNSFPFAIRTLAEDRLIGFIGFWISQWAQGDTWVGIGLGEPDYWGKGYGTDAMRTGLRFVFTELNRERVTLVVFGYNARAIRSYEKAGFVVEGRERGLLCRDGQRWDEIHMGILRTEWERRRD
jgi:RimJ/RimL family protein N-acetyltransferase